MELEQRVATAIRTQTDTVDPFVPDLDSIRQAARQTSRRRAGLAVGGIAVATVVTVVAVMAGTGTDPREHSLGPVAEPGGEGPRVVRIPDVRDDHVVVTPRLAPAVPPQTDRVVEVSSEDPGHDGSGELVVGVDSSATSYWGVSCTGAPDLRYVLLVEPGAQYFSSGRCDAAAESPVLRPTDSTAKTQVRLFVTDGDVGAFRRCFNYSPPQGCDSVEPEKAVGSSALMRVRAVIPGRWVGPVALTMFGEEFHAGAATSDGAYSLTGAAAGANGAGELSFWVEASDADRIAQVVLVATEQGNRCMEAGRRAVEGCMPVVERLIDGEPMENAFEGPLWYTGARKGWSGWGSLTPGADHEVTLRVVEGDPEHVNLGVLVYEVVR